LTVKSGLVVSALVVATVSGCGTSTPNAGHSTTAPSTTSPESAPRTALRTDAAGTVWLCRPGLVGDPCQQSLATTSVPAAGARTLSSPTSGLGSSFDCFYVYPTVSPQTTDNANLQIQPAEVDVAITQASPFSSLCRVWAPIYRQRTVASLFKGLGADPRGDQIAYGSVLAAWHDYLDNFNDGRPVIFIGHSQGDAMLIRLLTSQIDPDRRLVDQTVSAIIAGGNVAVPTGHTVGSTFKHLPLCTAAAETSCVIAYSTFPGPPPSDGVFGRPGQGVSLQSGQTATVGVEVACVNPAALAGGIGQLSPLFRTSTMTTPAPAVSTPWVTYPGLYSARCQTADGATWLQVSHVAAPGDQRPVVTESLGPAWGYHLQDLNLALGNLLADVNTEEQAYAARQG
jgi:hypothetical protein